MMPRIPKHVPPKRTTPNNPAKPTEFLTIGHTRPMRAIRPIPEFARTAERSHRHPIPSTQTLQMPILTATGGTNANRGTARSRSTSILRRAEFRFCHVGLILTFALVVIGIRVCSTAVVVAEGGRGEDGVTEIGRIVEGVGGEYGRVEDVVEFDRFRGGHGYWEWDGGVCSGCGMGMGREGECVGWIVGSGGRGEGKRRTEGRG